MQRREERNSLLEAYNSSELIFHEKKVELSKKNQPLEEEVDRAICRLS